MVGKQMHEARRLHGETGKAARVFTEFDYQTHKSWARARRVVAKAEYLDKGENPRFVVTSLTQDKWAAQQLYEKFYCQRGEMENRIKEQMCLFAYGTELAGAHGGEPTNRPLQDFDFKVEQCERVPECQSWIKGKR